MDVNYEYYKVFYYVAKYQSFTKAAEKLYANQPNITRTIKKLEELLNIKLFTRSGRNIILTQDGEILYDKIADALEKIENAEKEISLFGSLNGGYISIGTSEVALHKVFLPVVSILKAQYPNLKIRLSNYTAIKAIKGLRNGEYDVALTSTPLTYDDDLEYVKVCEFTDIPVYSSSLQLEDKVYTIKDLAKLPLITMGRDTASYTVYSKLFASLGEEFKPEFELTTADQLMPIVSCGLGVGLVPDPFAKDLPSDIKILKMSESLPSRNVYFIYPKKQHLNVAMKKLKEIILANIKND